MSTHDSTPDQSSADTRGRGALHVALADLAGTMPDDPRRLSNVHARARRLRRRRVAHTTVAAVAVAGAAGAAAFAAARPGSTQVSILPASEPTSASAPSPLPTCSAVLAALPPGSLTPPAAGGPAGDATKQDAPSSGKPAASSGADVPSDHRPSDQTLDDAAKAAAGADASRYVKSLAQVVSAPPGSLSLNILDGPLAGQSVTALTGPDTAYAAGAQSCVDPDLTAGMTVAVLLVRADDGSYSTRQVNLFQPS
jgi:hypothetical protein